MRRSVLAFLATFFLTANFNVVSAQELNVGTVVTLFDNTPMYNSPGDSKPTGAIAPQGIALMGAEENWDSYSSILDKKWFKARTWLGDQWIQLEIRRLGATSRANTGLWLSGGSVLFDSPFQDTVSQLALSEQTVHATASFRNDFQTFFLIDTWAGPKWIPYGERTVFPVAKVDEKVQLPTVTAKLSIPIAGYENGTLQPQSISVFERQDEWLHAKTETGETVWVNQNFAEPQGATKTDESVEVSVVTPLMKYPFVSDIDMGKIAPQTVTAFEKWISPKGELWYHIRSWKGDAWISSAK